MGAHEEEESVVMQDREDTSHLSGMPDNAEVTGIGCVCA